MTGVPGGDVTLHAAITETLAKHDRLFERSDKRSFCRCTPWDGVPMLPSEHRAHVADRLLAVLADRLPHTPPDQLAALIGGTVERPMYSGVEWVRGPQVNVDTWVPDSPPAAPEPRQDT